MKKILLSFIILISILGSVFAQPGYLGNKFSVNLSGDFFPSVRSKEYLEFGNYYLAGIKSTGGFNVSYVLSNYKTLEFGYSTFKDWNAEYSIEYRTFANLEYIKQNSFGISLKSFFRNSIAPLGSYFRLAAAYTNNLYSDDINFTTPKKYPGFKLGVGFGRQRIIIDKLVLDYGILGYINLIGNDEGFFSGIADLSILDDENTRILFRDQIYIHVGVGYLLF